MAVKGCFHFGLISTNECNEEKHVFIYSRIYNNNNKYT
jgi:hypothetical protein